MFINVFGGFEIDAKMNLRHNFRTKFKSELKNIYGTGDGSTVVFYLNGFQHRSLSLRKTPTFMVGISDANSSFDMIYGSTTIKAGQVRIFLWAIQIKATLFLADFRPPSPMRHLKNNLNPQSVTFGCF
jgi:hypothetical protein